MNNRVVFRENGNLNLMLCLLKKKLHTLCLRKQYRIKPIFPYFVNNLLALIYNVYVAVTNYVLYYIIFGEKLLQLLRGLLFFFLV